MDIGRREVLAGVGWAVAGASAMSLAGCTNPAGDATASTTPSPSAGGVSPSGSSDAVLVVGAGVAGLTAARDLTAAGVPVQVIEGRNRIGGRLWTSDAWPDVPIDLGASWIHGITGNPITALAEQAGATLATTSYDSAVAYDASGRQLGRAGEAAIARTTDEVFAALVRAQDADADQSVRSAIRRGLGWADLGAEQRRLVDFVTAGSIEAEYAGSAQELSTWWFDSIKEFPGPDAILPAGYSAISDLLAAGLPIATGQVVTDITWDDTGAQVTTTTARFTGSQVLVTVPLGVLQSGAIRFSPSLPADTLEAIRALGSGVLNKVFLRFEEVFWDDDVDWIEFIPDGGAPWVEWVSFARPTGQPILLAFAAADLGRTVDTWTDAQVVASAMTVARTMYGTAVPDPIAWQITRWGADPLAAGSYSFNALGSDPRMRDTLATPIDGRLHFAGEATEPQWFSTVHGAHLSGKRAARDILRT